MKVHEQPPPILENQLGHYLRSFAHARDGSGPYAVHISPIVPVFTCHAPHHIAVGAVLSVEDRVKIQNGVAFAFRFCVRFNQSLREFIAKWIPFVLESYVPRRYMVVEGIGEVPVVEALGELPARLFAVLRAFLRLKRAASY